MTITTAMILLAVSSMVHIAADILLLRGARENEWRSGFEALLKTPKKSLLAGALLGLITIPVWLVPSLYLLRIDGVLGVLAFFSYTAYIALLLLFHVSYAFIGIGIQTESSLTGEYRSLISIVGLCSMVLSTVFTVVMIIAGAGGRLGLAWYHYLLLPSFTVALFQYVLGRVLRSVPYFLATSGTLAMITFFISFIDLVQRNPSLL